MALPEEAKVLVADDDDALRTTLAEILSHIGYTVFQAQDGVEALEMLAHHEIDALLLDLKMPHKDGISVLNDLEPGPPPPGVLLISAYEIDPGLRGRFTGKVHKFLRKPVPPSTLVGSVQEAVELARSARNP
jgi:CheY-like chemotaxis protein